MRKSPGEGEDCKTGEKKGTDFKKPNPSTSRGTAGAERIHPKRRRRKGVGREKGKKKITSYRGKTGTKKPKYGDQKGASIVWGGGGK